MDRPLVVLVADDTPTSLDATARALREAGHRVTMVGEGGAALERILQDRPMVAVIEATLAGKSGLEICHALKNGKPSDLRPVLVLTQRGDAAARTELLRAGASDVLSRPCDAEELRARVEALGRLAALIDGPAAAAVPAGDGRRDPVTNLPISAFFAERLDEAYAQAGRSNDPLSVLHVDLDRLTAVNSRYGRPTGDRLLRAFAAALSRLVREADLVARGDDDDFLVLARGAHFAGAAALAEKIWRELRSVTVVALAAAAGPADEGAKVGCGVSVGVASFPNRDVAGGRDLLRVAQAALLRAKAEGYGRICLYQHQGYLYEPSSR